MSHFVVTVFTDGTKTIEKLLQPYHEFECTGDNDQYVQDVDCTEECREEGLDYHGLEDKTVIDESQVDREGKHKYGYAVVDTAGNIIKAINRTNPNKKWDWWVLGGRWSGFLKLKNRAIGITGEKGLAGSCISDGPGRSDFARKADIDSEGMRDDAGKKAAQRYDRAMAALGGESTSWISWQKMREEIHKGDIDVARKAYNEQPQVKALKEEFNKDFFFEIDQFLVDRDQYIQASRDNALTTYAFVKDGAWVGRGDMGWWGMSSDDQDKATWDRKYNELFDALSDDTLVAIVDCHI